MKNTTNLMTKTINSAEESSFSMFKIRRCGFQNITILLAYYYHNKKYRN